MREEGVSHALEARDRVGSRTWTSHLSDGELIEIGGSYVYWVQPHTWSEIIRYRLDRNLIDASEPVEGMPEGSFLSLLRWWAPTGHTYEAM